MNGIAIHTAELTKRFGELVAVESLTLDVRRGEVFGLLGPNGSGKTTTIRMLTGLLAPTSGVITVAGVYGLRRGARTAREAELFSELGLDARRNQLAGTLSGGWKQKLALACATAHHPDLVFLDEPTAGVDPAARRNFWTMIRSLAAGGMTILVTTHYMDEAARCDRLAFLSRGHLIGLGTPDEVTAQFGEASVEDVFIALQARDEGAGA